MTTEAIGYLTQNEVGQLVLTPGSPTKHMLDQPVMEGIVRKDIVGDVIFFRVLQDGTNVIHPQHGDLRLDAGSYCATIQVEQLLNKEVLAFD